MATSYTNFGGTGRRVGEIQCTLTGVLPGSSSGPLHRMLNGVTTGTTGANSWWWNNQSGAVDLMWDWGPGASVVVDEFTWYQQNTTTHGTWVFEGSNDLSGWTQIGSSFTLGGLTGANVYSFTNSTGYRAYRIRKTAGSTSNSPWLFEVEFKLEDLSPSTRCSLGNTGGQGNRTSVITTTTTMTLTGGTIDNLVDGGFADNTTDSINLPSGATSGEIRFDFGPGASKVIDALAWQQSLTNNNGIWTFEGSDDASAWTQIGSSFTLGNTSNSNLDTEIILFGNTTGYRYYRLLKGITGTNSTTFVREIEFRINDALIPFVEAYKNTQYAVLGTPRLAINHKTTQYSVLGTPSVESYKNTQYAVLGTPLLVVSQKTTQYSALGTPPADIFKAAQYSVLESPPITLSKDTMYTALGTPPLKVSKDAMYAALAAQHFAAAHKIASYSVIEPPPIEATKATMYGVLGTPPLSIPKVTNYTTLSSPPAKVPKETMYSVLEPHFVKTLKTTSYTVLDQLFVTAAKETMYSALGTPPSLTYKNTLYTVLFGVILAKSFKQTQYSVLAPTPQIVSSVTLFARKVDIRSRRRLDEL